MAVEGLRLALILSLAAMPIAAWGSPVFARRIRAGQRIRPEGPAGHFGKAGTPTMGGLVPLALILLGMGILWALGSGPSWGGGFVLAATVAGGVVGLLDDLRSQRKAAGFFPHQTLLVQIALGALLCALVPAMGGLELAVPFSSLKLSLAAMPVWAWAPLVIAGFVGTVNGVNLADGLDGLATGAWLLSLLGLLPTVGGNPELGGIALLGAGAGGGFLWANTYPARVFLGNVGAMGLGGFLFGIAFAGGALFLLPLVGGLFVATTLSVILQVGSYKLTGARLFKMAPLHHHLESGAVSWPHRIPGPNWPEPQVVVRLWVLGGAFALVGAVAGAFG